MVTISSHAAQRFAERVRPGLTVHGAMEELRRLVLVATRSEFAPAWLTTDDEHQSYLLIGDDVCLPLKRSGQRLVATTCLTRELITPWERAKRNRLRAARTAAVRARSRNNRDRRPDQEAA